MAVLAFLTLSIVANSQPRRSVGHARTADVPSSLNPLQKLIAAQKDALKQGDAATVTEATRPLIAYLLRDLAKLRLLEGKGPDAIDFFRKSIEQQDVPETHLELASALLRVGRAQDAATESAGILRSDPGNFSAWKLQGSALHASGDEHGAIDALSHALELQPDVKIAYALGSALLAAHEQAKAEKVFRQIISASGNAAIWHVAIGDAYREALYLEEAVGMFKEAIAIDPHVAHAEFFLGLTYLQMNQWGPNSQSFAHLRAAVHLAPHEYASNFYLGALESTDGADLASSNRHLQVALAADPRSPEVWLYLGLNAVREKNTVAAKRYLRKAIELTGSDEQRNNYQIRRVYAILGRILISEGNHEEGDALLAKYKRTQQQALSNSAAVIADAAAGEQARSPLSTLPTPAASFPGSGFVKSLDVSPEPLLTAKGVTPESNTTPDGPREIAATERQLSSLLADSYNDLGTAEARQGKYDAALAHFQEAERWPPAPPALLRNLGVAAFRVGNFAESARALNLSLGGVQSSGDRARQDDRTHMMLAMSLFSLGRFSDADAAFASIPEMTLQDARAAYSWAFSLAHSGKQQHANEIADVLTKQGLAPDVMSLACHLYMDTENYTRSVECFRALYQASPTTRLAHYQVAESLIRLDRPSEAVTELRRELELSPDNPDVQYSLAFALLLTSQKKEAVSILQNLTTTHPNHAQAQYQLGKALLEEGDVAPALKHLELAEQNDPDVDYIHYQLQAAYRKAGRSDDADRELRLYRDIKSRNREVATPM